MPPGYPVGLAGPVMVLGVLRVRCKAWGQLLITLRVPFTARCITPDITPPLSVYIIPAERSPRSSQDVLLKPNAPPIVPIYFFFFSFC